MRTILLTCSLAVSLLTFSQIDFDDGSMQGHRLLKEMVAAVENGDYEEINSILIAKDGKLVFEHYFMDNDADSKHNTRSTTKTMATLLTGIAIDKGFIGSEQEPMMKYLDHKRPVAHPDERKEDISIEDLLTMSTILECDDNNQASRGWEERMYIIEDWTQFYVDLPIRSYPYGPPPAEAPYGRSMSYCSAGAATLAEVVETAVDGTAADFARENLFSPLGITDYEFDYTPMGILNTAGGSEYRSRDLLKLIQLCLNEGEWNGERIISKEWIQKATTPKANAWEGMDYGYLLWLRDYGPENALVKTYSMAGNGGQRATAIPELNATVVITTTNYNNRNAHGYADALLDEFIVPSLQ